MNATAEFEAGATAIGAAVRLLLRRPGDVLPFYFVAVSAATVAQVPLLVAGAIVYLDLSDRGRITPLIQALREFDPGATGPGGGEPDLPPGLEEAIAELFTPTVVGAILLGVALAIVALLVTRAVAAAGIVAAIHAALVDDPPLPAGVAGVGRHWPALVVVQAFRATVVGLAILAAAVGVGLAATGSPLGALAGAALVVGVPVAALALYLPLAFAGQAIVVDELGALGGIERSARLLFRRPVAVLVYLAVAATLAVTLAVVSGVLRAAGVPRLVAVVTALVFLPFLTAFKTALYARRDFRERPGPETGSAAEPDAEPEPRQGTGRANRLVGGAGRSLRALGGFVRDHPLANLAALGLLLVGGGLGWAVTAPYGTRLTPPAEVGDVFGPFPVATFLDIAANNWLVAVGGSHAGLAVGVPTVAVLLFNGVLVGALAGVTDPTPFVALVLPHGLIEIPAIAVAGGVGLHLGRVAWGGLRGRRSAREVAEELERAYWVLLGLVLPFLLAAFVEAFVTPRIAAAVVGG